MRIVLWPRDAAGYFPSCHAVGGRFSMLSAFVSTRRNKARRSSPSAPRTSASALSVNTTMAGSHTSPRNGFGAI